MTLRFGLIATILITLNLSPGAFAQESGDPTGTWLTQAGDAKVQVSRCGTGLFWRRRHSRHERFGRGFGLNSM